MLTAEIATTETHSHLMATAQIVAAMQARGGDGGPIEALIMKIRKALVAPLEEPVPAVEELTPAVPIMRSVTPDAVICLECGKPHKSLKRHISSHHGMTPEEYRGRWDLPQTYPMVAPNYSAKRSQLAKDNGLGRK